ncbi:hypothetical protein RTH74_24030 [Pseudomonas sp. zfem001]|jgi:hypothetical protein|uniref:hypothetical protein n=1 Tax=Pseudomonas sp. zfem001 TaxID=3078196 RepID=UPI000854B821|nr:MULTISPECIES: hypothetical protein [Pseudomonas]MBU0885393.1 hypothetical protein [Gammaproteobacteria bacterium]MDU9410677.1 hypothetical protein [Pseudomonas sp. zfem001]MDZ4336648.1 hypothetical protein [Pseudomonas sp.]OEO27815.1 hypothetical protein AX279_00465 [Pseudomonas sp. J237]
MTDNNFTDGTHRDLTKYRITVTAALVGLALAGWMIQAAYSQHVQVLNIGDQTGERLQMRDLIEHQEGAQHEKR